MDKLLVLSFVVLLAGCTINYNTLSNISDNYDVNLNDSIVINGFNDNSSIIVNDSITVNIPDSDIIFFNWTDGNISLSMPEGWVAVSYGSCATKSFMVYDSMNPLRQVFYFSEAGPVYISESQKNTDLSWKDYYNSIGANYAIYWTDAPVVYPLTAESFLSNFKSLAESYVMRTIAPLAPKIYDVQIISSDKPSTKIFPSSTDAQIIRALFKQNNSLGEGLFYIETAEMPVAGIGYGMTFIGLTAKEDEFLEYEAVLNHIIKSYSISQDYVSKCIASQNAAAQSALKAGQILSSTSDNIMDSWDNRQRSDDILSEKWSDSILDYERVYNPETGEVYRVENGFYENYDIHRGNYQMNNLQQLPSNDWDLWTAPTNYQENIK
jgi:hypothetical protein